MVTYANITHKVTLFGVMYGGQEEWTTSFWLGNESGGDQGSAPTAAEALAIANAWETFFESSGAGISSRFTAQGVKVSHVSTDGSSDSGLTQFYNYGSSVVGQNTSNHFPPQISLAATLYTAIQRGAGSKGRMYLPGVAHSIDTTGHVETSNAVATATALKTFLDAVNAHADVPGEVVLNSAERTGVPFRAAAMVPIVGVKVGNVYDTQRRRRNQMVETYSTQALA